MGWVLAKYRAATHCIVLFGWLVGVYVCVCGFCCCCFFLRGGGEACYDSVNNQLCRRKL